MYIETFFVLGLNISVFHELAHRYGEIEDSSELDKIINSSHVWLFGYGFVHNPRLKRFTITVRDPAKRDYFG